MNTCHVERSETSLDVNWRIAFPKDLRFFASLRMTAVTGFSCVNS
jgi:hypothetical protein